MFRHIPHFNNTRHKPVAVGVVAALALGALAAAAGAAPIDDARSRAAAIQSSLDATNARIGSLAEQYNGAQLAVTQAEQTIADSQAKIDAAQAEVTRTKALVDERAAEVYRRALAGQSLDGFDLNDSSHIVTRRHYARAQTGRDDALMAQLTAAKVQLAKQQADAEQARATADAQRTQIETAKQELEAASAAQRQTLSQAQGEVAVLLAQQQQRRDVASLSSAQSRYAGGVHDSGSPEQFPDLPAPGAAAATAIDFARAQLGKPYVYAAAGPDAYDCSGLVMAAYRSAGVSLPHYSGAQYAKLPHVSLDAMQPGDLVFWGPAASDHVAIYLGAGRIIEAASGRGDVHIGPIWGHPMGAARVT